MSGEIVIDASVMMSELTEVEQLENDHIKGIVFDS